MLLSERLKRDIQSHFNIIFDVKPVIDMDNECYLIKPTDSYGKYFFLKLIIKNRSRITIECEPDTHGVYFIEELNKASEQQRKLFVNFWKEIAKDLKVSVKINDQEIDQESFIDKKINWVRFKIRATKPGFYDLEENDKFSSVSKYVNIVIGMVLSLLTYQLKGYEEGKAIEERHIRYERNPLNRELCLYAKGYTCAVCGFDFKKKYGELGDKFIEVHHIVPISELPEDYIIDPINDLIPLCSNCHSMIHRKKPPLSPEILRKIIKEN